MQFKRQSKAEKHVPGVSELTDAEGLGFAAFPSAHKNDPPNGKDDVFATRYQPTPEDLEDLLVHESIPANPEKGIMDWLEKVYRNSRGFEMGTFHSSLIQIMWKKQSSKWENLALGYTSDIVSITHTYICDLLKETCADDRLRAGLLSVMMEKLTERYRKAIDQTEFILQVERIPLTVNHYFADNLEKW